jgi:hypothetical protein
MSRKALGGALIAVGLLVVLFFVLADVTGAGGSPGFGIRQILGTIAGAVVIVIGALISRRQRASGSS